MKFATFVLAAGTAFSQTPDGEALYAKHCARCHETDQTGWSPRRAVLAKLPPGTHAKTIRYRRQCAGPRWVYK